MSARIRFRPRITKKTMCFFLPSARIELLPIFEKNHLILVHEKNIPKKFQEINKTFFQLCFFLLVFFVALINFI